MTAINQGSRTTATVEYGSCLRNDYLLIRAKQCRCLAEPFVLYWQLYGHPSIHRVATKLTVPAPAAISFGILSCVPQLRLQLLPSLQIRSNLYYCSCLKCSWFGLSPGFAVMLQTLLVVFSVLVVGLPGLAASHGAGTNRVDATNSLDHLRGPHRDSKGELGMARGRQAKETLGTQSISSIFSIAWEAAGLKRMNMYTYTPIHISRRLQDGSNSTSPN